MLKSKPYYIMEYKVVPFVASIDPKKGNTSHVAEQLQETIRNHVNLGWEYVGLESVITYNLSMVALVLVLNRVLLLQTKWWYLNDEVSVTCSYPNLLADTQKQTPHLPF